LAAPGTCVSQLPDDENIRAVASAHCMAGLNSARW